MLVKAARHDAQPFGFAFEWSVRFQAFEDVAPAIHCALHVLLEHSRDGGALWVLEADRSHEDGNVHEESLDREKACDLDVWMDSGLEPAIQLENRLAIQDDGAVGLFRRGERQWRVGRHDERSFAVAFDDPARALVLETRAGDPGVS